MSVVVNLHPMLQDFSGGNKIVEAEGSTVGEVLEALFAQYPDLKDQILNKDGRLKRHLDVFVNDESSYPQELNKRVRDGDHVTVIMMIAGG